MKKLKGNSEGKASSFLTKFSTHRNEMFTNYKKYKILNNCF